MTKLSFAVFIVILLLKQMDLCSIAWVVRGMVLCCLNTLILWSDLMQRSTDKLSRYSENILFNPVFAAVLLKPFSFLLRSASLLHRPHVGMKAKLFSQRVE